MSRFGGLFAKRRRVTVDANIIVAALIYGCADCRDVLDTVNECDQLMMTNIILFQCTRQGRKKKCPVDSEEIERRVREICPDVKYVEIIPLEQLKTRYYIRSDKDYETLYSADVTDSEILLTSDNDFYDPERPVKGIRAKILRMDDYLKGRGRR